MKGNEGLEAVSCKDAMEQELINLFLLRKKRDQCKDAYDNAWKEFQDLNAALLGNMENNKTQLSATEETLRTLALQEFSETGEKKLVGGIGIRIMKRLEYDEKEAFAWALRHEVALQLNKRDFENVAKLSLTSDLNFVIIKEEPQATLPKVIKPESKDATD